MSQDDASHTRIDLDALRTEFGFTGVALAATDPGFSEAISGGLWNQRQPGRAPQAVAQVATEQDVAGGGAVRPRQRDSGIRAWRRAQLVRAVAAQRRPADRPAQPQPDHCHRCRSPHSSAPADPDEPRGAGGAQPAGPLLPHRPLPHREGQWLSIERRDGVEPRRVGAWCWQCRGDRPRHRRWRTDPGERGGERRLLLGCALWPGRAFSEWRCATT